MAPAPALLSLSPRSRGPVSADPAPPIKGPTSGGGPAGAPGGRAVPVTPLIAGTPKLPPIEPDRGTEGTCEPGFGPVTLGVPCGVCTCKSILSSYACKHAAGRDDQRWRRQAHSLASIEEPVGFVAQLENILEGLKAL